MPGKEGEGEKSKGTSGHTRGISATWVTGQLSHQQPLRPISSTPKKENCGQPSWHFKPCMDPGEAPHPTPPPTRSVFPTIQRATLLGRRPPEALPLLQERGKFQPALMPLLLLPCQSTQKVYLKKGEVASGLGCAQAEIGGCSTGYVKGFTCQVGVVEVGFRAVRVFKCHRERHPHLE